MSIFNRFKSVVVRSRLNYQAYRGSFGVTKPLYAKQMPNNLPYHLEALKDNHVRIWYKVLDSTGNLMHRNFPASTSVAKSTFYDQLRYIIHDENITLLSEFEVEDIELYKNKCAYATGETLPLNDLVSETEMGDPLIAVLRNRRSHFGVKDGTDSSTQNAESGSNNKEGLTRSQCDRFSTALVIRSLLSHVAYEARKLY